MGVWGTPAPPVRGLRGRSLRLPIPRLPLGMELRLAGPARDERVRSGAAPGRLRGGIRLAMSMRRTIWLLLIALITGCGAAGGYRFLRYLGDLGEPQPHPNRWTTGRDIALAGPRYFLVIRDRATEEQQIRRPTQLRTNLLRCRDVIALDGIPGAYVEIVSFPVGNSRADPSTSFSISPSTAVIDSRLLSRPYVFIAASPYFNDGRSVPMIVKSGPQYVVCVGLGGVASTRGRRWLSSHVIELDVY
jgi:hypothetical protein